MSIVPAKETERTRHEPGGQTSVSSGSTCDGEDGLLLLLGRRRMRVTLCSRCPYSPRGLAGHYDPNGVLHVCAKCDGQQGASTNHYPRKAHRRQQCAIVRNSSVTAEPSAARSATESLVSSGTTLAEPPSVQRSAPTASRHARKAIGNGYANLTLPDNDCGNTPMANFRSSGFRSKEFSQ